MTEWQVLDSDQFSNSDPEHSQSPRRHRLWFFIAAAILILIVSGTVILYQQWLQRQAEIEDDLISFIFEEEGLRFAGRENQISEIIIPSAPPGWQQRYRNAFIANSQPPPTIRLSTLDFDGECAVVNVFLNNDERVRNYCLVDGRWRRAPVLNTVWGGEQKVLSPGAGVRLNYQPRDNAFATSLAANLPQLISQLEPWLASDETYDIAIEPRDLEVPLISASGSQIVLNSPLLTPIRGQTISNQTDVRAALVKALLRRAGLVSQQSSTNLPGAKRFQHAAQTVIAANLLLDAGSQATLVANWQARLENNWTSPFFGDSPVDESQTVARSDLAAYLIAEYIYRTEGLVSLIESMKMVSQFNSWDDLFGNTLNQPVSELERGTAAHFQIGDDTDVPISKLPLSAKLLGVEQQPSGSTRAYTVNPDSGRPLWVELRPELTFSSANGTALPAECLPAETGLKIDGEWLEIGQRLEADRIVIEDVSLLSIEPAPPDTTAYLIQGQPPPDIDQTVNYVFPSNRLFFAPNDLVTPQALVAVRKDGTIQQLTPLNSNLQVVPLPIAAGDTPHFMFILDLPGCEQRWFVHYQPEQGITGQWLAPPPPMNWLWQAEQRTLLFFDSVPGGAGHTIYKADALSYRPIGKSEMLVSFAGWKGDTGQLVFIRRDWGGAIGLGLLEPVTGSFRRAKVYVYPLHARRLSPDGQWLAFLTGVRNRIDPPYRLDLLNFDTLTETTAIQVESEQAIGPAVWSQYVDKPQLAALSGPLAWEDVLRPNRLLVASLSRSNSFEVLAEVEAGVSQLAAPVFCADGSLLYRIDEDNRYQLVRHLPGQAAEILFSSDQLFKPVACP